MNSRDELRSYAGWLCCACEAADRLTFRT
jgi:hypothetical protein